MGHAVLCIQVGKFTQRSQQCSAKKTEAMRMFFRFSAMARDAFEKQAFPLVGGYVHQGPVTRNSGFGSSVLLNGRDVSDAPTQSFCRLRGLSMGFSPVTSLHSAPPQTSM